MKEKQSGDVFALKTLKKSQTLAQESVSCCFYYLAQIVHMYHMNDQFSGLHGKVVLPKSV